MSSGRESVTIMLMKSDMRRTLTTATMVLLAITGCGLASGVTARAEGCSNEHVRALQVFGSGLPDCRAYEQVSVKKNGADALGTAEEAQASPSGNAITFFSAAPFPGAAGAKYILQPQLGLCAPIGLCPLSSDTWSTQGLLPPADPATDFTEAEPLTEDLARTVVVAQGPVLAQGAMPGAVNAYIRDNATGTYQLLAPNIGFSKIYLVDATRDDSRILFETRTELSTTNIAPAPGHANLYEWDEGKPVGERVSLVGVLSGDKAPAEGSVAGPGGPAVQPKEPGGSTSQFYTQDTISENGSRVFFTDFETGFIYMREPEVDKTIQVSAGSEPAFWRAATPDGNFVFYTEGGELYRFNVKQFEESNKPEAVALAEAREPLTSGAKGVLGTLGASDKGSYLYFVASSVLASNKRGTEEAESGKNNLYVWHQGTPVAFIAHLQDGQDADEENWVGLYDATNPSGASGGEKSARVTPDGTEVLFSSVSPLTGHASVPACETKAHPCYELYLYEAESSVSPADLVCVSCNPTGATTTGDAFLSRQQGGLPITINTSARNAFVTHNLSDGGGRVFFETNEALVPGDVNSQWDVYEWERQGVGSCTSASSSFSASSGGCLYLLSSGQSARTLYFGDASADGSDVFFFTEQSLVSGDQDNNLDVYDARIGGGITTQNVLPSVPCGDEAGCRGASSAPPVFGAPSSVALSGPGNLEAPSLAAIVTKKRTVKCSRGRKRSHGKCVKVKNGKRKAKKADNKRRGK